MQFFGYMGYDKAVSMYSPDGRIVQLDYALNTISKSKLSLALVTKESVVFAGLKERSVSLISEKNIEKIFKIDDHIATILVGFLPDGLALVKELREIALSHKLLYDEPISLLALIYELSSTIQIYTQYGGARPFGVNLMTGAIEEDEPKLTVIGPSGEPYRVYAWAAGEGYSTVIEFLEQNYKVDKIKSMTTNDGIDIAIRALKQIKRKLKPNELELAHLDKDGLKIYTREELGKILEKYSDENEQQQ